MPLHLPLQCLIIPLVSCILTFLLNSLIPICFFSFFSYASLQNCSVSVLGGLFCFYHLFILLTILYWCLKSLFLFVKCNYFFFFFLCFVYMHVCVGEGVYALFVFWLAFVINLFFRCYSILFFSYIAFLSASFAFSYSFCLLPAFRPNFSLLFLRFCCTKSWFVPCVSLLTCLVNRPSQPFDIDYLSIYI